MLGILVRYVVDQLHNLEAEISKIRIVKLLYLIDVAYYRTRRQLLTGAEWIAHKYGPYAFEIDRAIKTLGYRIETEEVLTSHGYQAFVYRPDEEAEVPRTVDIGTKMMIDEVIHRWAYESLNDLLNHVYFRTAPMEEAEFGERLNFELIARPTGLAGASLQIPATNIERYRAALGEVRQRRLRNVEQTSVALRERPVNADDAYRDAMARRDKEEMSGSPRRLRLGGSQSALT